MSGTLYPGAPNPAEDLERQTGNLARDLARAIARIGELDVTRTLPGRLVWYVCPFGCPFSLPVLGGCEHTGADFIAEQIAPVGKGRARKLKLHPVPPLAKGDSR